MKVVAKIVAPLALAATMGAPALHFAGTLGDTTMKAVLLAATVAWFAAAPVWMESGR
jgi:hypothetical protein